MYSPPHSLKANVVIHLCGATHPARSGKALASIWVLPVNFCSKCILVKPLSNLLYSWYLPSFTLSVLSSSRIVSGSMPLFKTVCKQDTRSLPSIDIIFHALFAKAWQYGLGLHSSFNCPSSPNNFAVSVIFWAQSKSCSTDYTTQPFDKKYNVELPHPNSKTFICLFEFSKKVSRKLVAPSVIHGIILSIINLGYI